MTNSTKPTPANPNAQLSMSREARNRLRDPRHEAVVWGYYNDGKGTKGHCSYGIGMLAHRGPCTPDELARPLSSAQIEAAFSVALKDAERAVRRNIPSQPLTQEQFDALVSYTYNIGPTGASRVYRHINQGNFQRAADTITANVFSKQAGRLVRMPGLIKRRREESAPFRALDSGAVK